MPDESRRSLIERLRVPPSDWLWPRLAAVPISYGRTVRAATAHGGAIRLELDDDTQRETDHVLLATGYDIDVGRHPFLGPELRSQLQTIGGAPRLYRGFESSVPSLHFVGPVAAASFGPIMESIAGTGFAARTLAGHLTRRRRVIDPSA
jgi:hypothetical protein